MPNLPVDIDLVRKYSVPGPRYTSYPTALHFEERVDGDAVLGALRASGAGDRPLSLYVHLPFCKYLCWYCGCTTVITRDRSRSAEYVDYLIREMDSMRRHVGDGRTAVQLHYGGGTPTFLHPEELRKLGHAIRSRFEFHPEAEISVEIDPRGMVYDHVKALRETGFNRASIGVQDADPAVQAAVNRLQSVEETMRSILWLREEGYRSINVDLIYGLPHQSAKSFERTIDTVLAMDPERLAVFSYAHVPWMKPAQKLLDAAGLPSPEEKLCMLKLVVEMLTGAGYVYIGMDHFARPDDDLAVAQRDGRLQRNFQGYSTWAGVDILGIGMSSISQTEDAYFQNVKVLPAYYERLDAGRPAFHRGVFVSDEDRLRRRVIMQLMCNLYLDFDEISAEFGIDAADHFRNECDTLAGLGADGLVILSPRRITITDAGRLFVRNIAMAFDAYLGSPSAPKRYSKTV